MGYDRCAKARATGLCAEMSVPQSCIVLSMIMGLTRNSRVAVLCQEMLPISRSALLSTRRNVRASGKRCRQRMVRISLLRARCRAWHQPESAEQALLQHLEVGASCGLCKPRVSAQSDTCVSLCGQLALAARGLRGGGVRAAGGKASAQSTNSFSWTRQRQVWNNIFCLLSNPSGSCLFAYCLSLVSTQRLLFAALLDALQAGQARACYMLHSLFQPTPECSERCTCAARLVIALAGVPGSGKSTIAVEVCSQLNTALGRPLAVVVPMDGMVCSSVTNCKRLADLGKPAMSAAARQCCCMHAFPRIYSNQL